MSKAIELTEAFGFLYMEETQLLIEMAERVKDQFGNDPSTCVVNIGAGVGTSGLVFAEVLPKATRYTIDISAGSPHGGLKNERNAFKDISHLLPVQLHGNSSTVEWKTRPIHLLFVDGGHTYDIVKKDIKRWTPHVVGYVLFHDYAPTYGNSVMKAIDEWQNDEFEEINHVKSVKVFRRNDG